MRLLLDTHVLLWWLADDAQLDAPAREAIANADEAFVSTVSVWEISLKTQLGKLDAPADIAQQLFRHSFDVLPLFLDHAIAYRDLPPLHRDPFDRMLVAQAVAETLTLVTHDSALAQYDVDVLMAGAARG